MKAARIVIICSLTIACFAAVPPQKKASLPQKKASLPNVFLFTIDTLRADHVHCYGDQNIETPALDSLAKEGIRFTQAFTPSPITNTSHTTILTGLLPSSHGVTDFAIPLASTHVTWAELLKAKGYHTAGFIGAVILDSKSLSPGLDRGFDFYDNFPQHPKTKSRWGRVERRGLEVVQHAETWLSAHPAGPHFVWVHLYDPHDPYEPPSPFSETYKDRLYDGEVAYADSALAHFVAYLKKQGWYENSVIVVVGDHGEGLGEHHEETHGIFLYDSTTHVPLIVKLPSGNAVAKVVDAQVRTTDNAALLSNLKSTLNTLELQRTGLMAKYDPSYRLVQEVEQQIAETKAAIVAQEKGQLKDDTTDRNPVYAWADQELTKAKAALPPLQAQKDANAVNVATYNREALAYNEGEIKSSDLMREVKAEEQNYLLYLGKREQTRISDKLDEERVLNVVLAEPPTIPLVPTYSPLLLVIVSFLLAGLVSVGTALTADYLDSSFRTPDEVKEILRIPVFASIPVSKPAAGNGHDVPAGSVPKNGH